MKSPSSKGKKFTSFEQKKGKDVYSSTQSASKASPGDTGETNFDRVLVEATGKASNKIHIQLGSEVEPRILVSFNRADPSKLMSKSQLGPLFFETAHEEEDNEEDATG